MKRILDENAIEEAKTKWEYYVPRIIKQAKMEKGGHVEKKIRELTLAEEDCKITKFTRAVVFTKCVLCMYISYR